MNYWVDNINFVWRGNRTEIFRALSCSKNDGGVRPDQLVRSARYIGTAIRNLETLVSAGFVEVRYIGPRGGKRYCATPAGLQKLEQLGG